MLTEICEEKKVSWSEGLLASQSYGSEEILVPTATSHQTNQHDLHHPEREEQLSHKRLFFFGVSVQSPLSRKLTTDPSKKTKSSRK